MASPLSLANLYSADARRQRPCQHIVIQTARVDRAKKAYNSASGGLVWVVESEAPDPPGSIFHVAEQGVCGAEPVLNHSSKGVPCIDLPARAFYAVGHDRGIGVVYPWSLLLSTRYSSYS